MSQRPILISKGIIVNETGLSEGDIFINEGIIQEIGVDIEVPEETIVIDATDRYILPGGIDPHTHLETEFMDTKTADDFFQGTKAAIAGGTTTIIDFVIPKRDQTLKEAYSAKKQIAEGRACCNYGFHVAVVSCNDKIKEEMAELVKEEFGVNSFKFFMAYKDSLMLNDSELYTLFEVCHKIGAIAQVHAENGDIIAENTKRLLHAGITGPKGHRMSRPEQVEAEAVTRAATIAEQVYCPLYIVHVMSISAAEAVERASAHDNVIFGETIVAAIGCDGTVYDNDSWEYAAGYILSPPLSPNPRTPEYLLKCLINNTLEVLGSDHCTFTKAQKAIGRNNFSLIPNGVNGIEERLLMLWQNGVVTGLIDMPKFVEVTSTKVAKIFNLYPKKGVLAKGSDADIVIWNPNLSTTISSQTHNSACDFNIFEGRDIQGSPEYVIVNGTISMEKFDLKVDSNIGQFVPMMPWSPYVYDMIKKRYKVRFQ